MGKNCLQYTCETASGFSESKTGMKGLCRSENYRRWEDFQWMVKTNEKAMLTERDKYTAP